MKSPTVLIRIQQEAGDAMTEHLKRMRKFGEAVPSKVQFASVAIIAKIREARKRGLK